MSLHGVKLSFDSDYSAQNAQRDTYEDYGLFLMRDGFTITAPEINENYIEVPGTDGGLDAGDAPQGYPTYKNRTLAFSLFANVGTAELDALRTTIANVWHGVRCRIWLPTDSTHYYLGRVRFGDVSTSEKGVIPCSATVYPFKLKNDITTVSHYMSSLDWESFTVSNERRFVVPKITISRSMTVQMLAGVSDIPPEVTLTVASEGTAQSFYAPDTLLMDGAVPMRVKLVDTTSIGGYFQMEYREGCF